MVVIGIIAEFNPFHSGHKYLIDRCKKDLGADKVIVVMSGDYVQRGAPAIMDKFSRARMALKSGADIVIELPVYYSLGSAEYFAEGAVSILDGLGCVDYLCFGSEYPDLGRMERIADILCSEPPAFKKELSASLKSGLSYPSAVSRALDTASGLNSLDQEQFGYSQLFSSPNGILAIEYLKSLRRRNSSIKPYTIERLGQPYHSLETTGAASVCGFASASGIRAHMLSGTGFYIKSNAEALLKDLIPDEVIDVISHYDGLFLNSNDFSGLLRYRLICEKGNGYTGYQDVTGDISNKISKGLDSYDSMTGFCTQLKSKDIVYARISRCLMHILLGISAQNMSEYKHDGYTTFCRILGFKESAKDLLKIINSNAAIPVIERLKSASRQLSPLQKRLLDETLTASSIYNCVSQNGIVSEYSLRPLIIK
jgi:predicted nucleotidyltransferase